LKFGYVNLEISDILKYSECRCILTRSVIAWKIVGADRRMRPFLLPMQKVMCGQGKFVRLLSQDPIHRRAYSNAGIAGVPIFIWTSPVHWMWAYVTGRKKYQNRRIK